MFLRFQSRRLARLSMGFCSLIIFCKFTPPVEVLADEPEFSAEHIEFFEKQIRPLFAEHCYSCHGATSEKLQAGLVVDSRQGLIAGGDSGTAMVPGDPDSSLLVEVVRYEGYEMPPQGKLPAEDIAAIERWVALGAPWPKEDAPSIDADIEKFDLQARAEQHWAWQPIRDPALPRVERSTWPLIDADRFVLKKLEQAGLQPTENAHRLAILRRVYIDIIGLPPTTEQINEFISDTSDDALAQVVDQLLDSPHFGERWGRHWLDLVRYAESRGHEFDNDTPNAYQYRDYVIRALNADIPHDQLVREHIAGDLLDSPRLHPTSQSNESVLGTGFWYLGEWVHSPVDIRKDEADRFDNMIDVMSKAFLGVTVACARCHDHKFDAISTADYYSLSGFLQSSDYRQVRFESLEQNRRVASQLEELDLRYEEKVAGFLAGHGIIPPIANSNPSDLEGIIVDYANPASVQYLQDGYIFGLHPRRAGQIELNAGGEIDIAVNGAAANDLFWNGLTSMTQGAIQNQSKLDSLPKSGRTLRTPAFDLQDGKVVCLVQGRGHIVACVDSHRLIAGPLHGQTIREIKADERWVKLDLSRYLGHRVHLEFVPAQDAQLAIRMVVQGMDDQELGQLDEQLKQQDIQFESYARAAEGMLNGSLEVQRQMFADFESGTYGNWQATGDAFGEMPQSAETIASYQGDVNHRGTFFVNSHNLRKRDADSAAGDAPTGTLTSPKFLIDFDEIEFLVGGGAHAGKTCVNLIIDGNVVLSATGKNNNQMSLQQWDVRPFAGKNATIQMVDDHEGGWGNIGADEFSFIKTVKITPSKATANESADGAPNGNHILLEWKEAREQLRTQVVLKSHVAPAMLDGTGEDDYVLIRGNSSKPGQQEPRHFLTAIAGDSPLEIPSGSGRLQLAEQMNDPANPLTARVIVNRIWHYLVGRGIVPTVDDFGVLGQRPTHPDLLDHLASKFLADGRSIKRMIRYIVLSRTYQMSTKSDAVAVAEDPNNLLWHHRPPKRLEGEVIRDSLLAISGKLDKSQFGPPVPIHLTNFMDGRGRPGVNGPLDGDGRRSIYISVRRNFLSPFMLTFDTPVPFSTMGRRNVSNVPAQALILMNDPFVVQQAEKWAERVVARDENVEQQICWMYLTAFARQPTADELAIASRFLGDTPEPANWAQLAHILINTKEFIFLR